MKDILFSWLAIQLVVVGYSIVDIHNKVVRKEYHCRDTNEIVSPWKGALMPVVFFLPEYIGEEVESYCAK